VWNFEKGAAEDLAEFVAADLMRLKTEIEKLATYVAGKKVIGRADISALVISEKDDDGLGMADMLASRQSKKKRRNFSTVCCAMERRLWKCSAR